MVRYKSSLDRKVKPEKTTPDLAIQYANYLYNRFPLIQQHKGPLTFHPTSDYDQKVLDYLKKHADQNHRNVLDAILLVTDFWYSGRFATGGRMCLYIGGRGSLFEALDSDVIIIDPVDYEKKDEILRKIFSRLSPTLPPNVGNSHVHPHLNNLEEVTVQTIRHELAFDHGTQNSTKTQAPLQFCLHDTSDGIGTWKKNTLNSEITQAFAYKV